MRLSTKARYAVRAMIDMTLNANGGAVTRDKIAERQEISPLYLSHILLRLGKAGLVVSSKGPGGGYYLAKSPEAITAGDIVRAVGEPTQLVACTSRETAGCHRLDTCAAHLLWKRLATVVRDTLDAVTLAELCQDARRLMAPEAEREAASTRT